MLLTLAGYEPMTLIPEVRRWGRVVHGAPHENPSQCYSFYANLCMSQILIIINSYLADLISYPLFGEMSRILLFALKVVMVGAKSTLLTVGY